MNDGIPFNQTVAGVLAFPEKPKDPDYCIYLGERFYRTRKGYTSFMNFQRQFTDTVGSKTIRKRSKIQIKNDFKLFRLIETEDGRDYENSTKSEPISKRIRKPKETKTTNNQQAPQVNQMPENKQSSIKNFVMKQGMPS
jgi:hypothetical protein